MQSILNEITYKDVRVKLGEWCMAMRKAQKMSQAELADKLSLSRITISNLESGKNFTIDTFLKVLQHFDRLDTFHKFSLGEIEKSAIIDLY